MFDKKRGQGVGEKEGMGKGRGRRERDGEQRRRTSSDYVLQHTLSKFVDIIKPNFFCHLNLQ